jgi:hypothetical protein
MNCNHISRRPLGQARVAARSLFITKTVMNNSDCGHLGGKDRSNVRETVNLAEAFSFCSNTSYKDNSTLYPPQFHATPVALAAEKCALPLFALASSLVRVKPAHDVDQRAMPGLW